MPSGQVHWTLVFTTASLEHLAERDVDAPDVVDAVYGRYGPVRVRRTGRGARERWFIVAPLEDGELLTCVFRAALLRDLNAAGSFVLTAAGRREPSAKVDSSMKLCVSARLSDQDEIRGYRRWRQDKGGR